MGVQIVMAALVRDGRVLLGHRHAQREWYPDCWDLVGGHVEPGESPQAAVIRECREELGVDVNQMVRVDLAVADDDIDPHVFVVTGWTGEPRNAAPEEHDDLAWFGITDLLGLELADPAYTDWLAATVRAHG